MKNEWDLGVHRQGNRKDRMHHHVRQEIEVHGQQHKGEGRHGGIMEIFEHLEKMFGLFVFLWPMRSFERVFDEESEIIS